MLKHKYSIITPINPQSTQVDDGGSLLFAEEGGFGYHSGDNIRVHVRRWPSILEISFALFLSVPTNTN